MDKITFFKRILINSFIYLINVLGRKIFAKKLDSLPTKFIKEPFLKQLVYPLN